MSVKPAPLPLATGRVDWKTSRSFDGDFNSGVPTKSPKEPDGCVGSCCAGVLTTGLEKSKEVIGVAA